MTHASGPSKPKTITSTLRHQCPYVIQFKIIIILIMTFSQCSHYKAICCCIFTVNFSAPATQRRSQVKWLTHIKPEKNAWPASALFQCSLVRSYAADTAAADHKPTPPPPMKNARRAAGQRTTQRRRRPPVRRRTALNAIQDNEIA